MKLNVSTYMSNIDVHPAMCVLWKGGHYSCLHNAFGSVCLNFTLAYTYTQIIQIVRQMESEKMVVEVGISMEK